MSEHLAGAAAALNAPEELVERSARARAEASGVSVDDILAAWAGGAPVAPAAAPAATPTPDPAPAATETAAATPEPTAPPAETAPAATAAPAAAVVGGPARNAAPVLDARRENGWLLIAGIVGMLALGLLVSFVLPATAGGDETHIVANADLTDLQERGREVYVQQGCAACHTQLVRPVLADVGLGPVTETDTLALDNPATYGLQRIGPDLTSLRGRGDIGTVEWIVDFLRDPAEVNHDSLQPSYAFLSDEDLLAVATYVAGDKFDLPEPDDES